MSPDEIIEKQQESITAINSVLPHLPISSVRVLLQKYNASVKKMKKKKTKLTNKYT